MKNIKEYTENKKQELKGIIDKLDKKPILSIIQLGNNEASNSYIKGKIKDAEELGVITHYYKLTGLENKDIVGEDGIIADIFRRENRESSGIIIQLPIEVSDENKDSLQKILLDYVDESKDVDALVSNKYVNPCTPTGIINYLIYNDFDFNGKNVVVIGRSDLVGKPLARMLEERNATVTLCHSHTNKESLKQYVKNADLVVVAVGKPNFLNKKEFEFNENSIIIDVGINRIDGKLVGDCEKDLPVKFQSPVPGGVGLLTRLALFENLLTLVEGSEIIELLSPQGPFYSFTGEWANCSKK